ncbi:hypothetical protein M3667_06570 [Microbacterium sp. P26]|uniref:hypothetical protein n=1 Tax=Microbacterium TaxID=33882 RepID=UPI00203DAD23|nr:hypothetical protein [Microbacterium sp. P26]MCM3501543.1 hypothetical protein [Microbacterium sp. P26]
MTRRAPQAAAIAALAVVTALALAGCSASATPETAPSVAATASGPPVEGTAPTDSPEPEDAPSVAPTCENIIPKATADDFTSLGWTSQEEPFRVGAEALDEGIQCKWGDQNIASDRVQIFGWAPIDDATAAQAVSDLTSAGWKVEKDTDGTYVTENPDWLGGRGVDGYGLTYLFGDGFVKFADTRQSLLLVDSPRAS